MRANLVGSFLVVLGAALPSVSFAQVQCKTISVDYADDRVLLSNLVFNENFTCDFKGGKVQASIHFIGWKGCEVSTRLALQSRSGVESLKVTSATITGSGKALFNLENQASPVACTYDSNEVKPGTIDKAMKIAQDIEKSNLEPSPLTVYTAQSKIYKTNAGQSDEIVYFVEKVYIEAKTSAKGQSAYKQYKMEWQNGTLVDLKLTYSSYPQIL